MNKKGKYVKKEIKLTKNKEYRITIHNKIFYIYSVSFHRSGKVRAGVHGKDGIGYFRGNNISGKTAYYQKMDSEMYLRGVFKTVHIGV